MANLILVEVNLDAYELIIQNRNLTQFAALFTNIGETKQKVY